MILEEAPCSNCSDGSEIGDRGGLRTCGECRGMQKMRECHACRATGHVHHKLYWLPAYVRAACKECRGRGWTPAWDDTPTRVT